MQPSSAAGSLARKCSPCADADDERAAEAGADDQLGLAGADDGQAISTLEHAERLADGVDQVAVEVLGDELGDDLGIGVAVEDERRPLEAAA